jgi:VanZ family protein
MKSPSPVNRNLIVIVSVAGAVLFQQVAQFSTTNAFTSSLANWAHVPMFVGITALLMWSRPRQPVWQVFAIVVGLATLTEGLQHFTGRQPSIVDICRDLLGFAIAAFWLRDATLQNRIAAAALTLAACLAVPTTYLLAYHYHARSFPILYSPADLLASVLTTTDSETRLTSEHPWSAYVGRQVLHITWSGAVWPGVHFVEPVERWGQYCDVVVDAYNLDENLQPLTVAVRHESTGGTSRYDSMDLAPGHNTLRVSVAKLASGDDGESVPIKHLMLYTTQLHAGKKILLGLVRLDSCPQVSSN